MTAEPIALADQLREMIFRAFIAWAFAPVLAGVVRYGDVILTFHNGKLHDVNFQLGGFREFNKSPG